MKKLIPAVIICMSVVFISCNNEGKKDSDNPATQVPKTAQDSLMADVLEGHDEGMGKMNKITAMQKNIQQVLDSIARLPAKAKLAAEPLKVKMNGLLEELNSAKDGMEKWMAEFNYDSAMSDVQQRIKYLTTEKLKVNKVKESMLESLHKADSLLKAKL